MRRCRVCGCTEFTPCVDDIGQACSWVGPDLCSACAYENRDSGVQLYTDAEANSFIRQLRYADADVARAEARVRGVFERYLSAGGGAC